MQSRWSFTQQARSSQQQSLGAAPPTPFAPLTAPPLPPVIARSEALLKQAEEALGW